MRLVRKRLSQNTLALLLSNGGSALLSFLLSVLIGRVLGEGGLGTYAAALAWVFPLSLLTEFGLGTLITRDVAQSLESAHATLRATVQARLLLGGGAASGLFLLAPLLSDDALLVQGLQLSAPLILIVPLYSAFTAVFRAHQRMRPIAVLNLGMLLAQVMLTTLVFLAGGGILAALLVNTLTSYGQLVAAWAVYRRAYYQPSKEHIASLSLLKRAYPFAIAALLAAVQMRLNVILLEQWVGVGAVGLFAAASRFVEAGRMLPHAFFDALFPLLASLAERPAALERLFRRVLLGLLAFGLVFAVGMQLAAEWLIRVSYGEAFADAAMVLQIAAWGLIPLLLKGGRTLYWYAQGKEQFVNAVTLLVIFVQLAAAWWLIPRYGAVGAALTSVLAESVAFALLMLRRR